MHRYRKLIFSLIPFAMAMSAVPLYAAEECTLSNVSTIELSYDAVGRPLIPMTLNDLERYFLIDTGGVYSTHYSELAEVLDLRLRRAGGSIIGVTGESSNNYVTVDEFRVGTVRGRDRPFMIEPGDQGGGSEIRRVGTIGPDILARYDIDLDFGSSKVNMFSQDHCEGQVIYWQPKTIAIIPFELDRGGHITFPILLDGVELTAIMDTGAATSTLNQNVGERELGLDFSSAENELIGTLGEDNDEVYRRKFQSLSMAGIEIREPTLDVLPDLMGTGLGTLFGWRTSTSLPDVIVGMSILSHLHVYIAYGEERLYITEAGGSGAN